MQNNFMNIATTRDEALALDDQDPLAQARTQFKLPDDVIYFVGHSLGPPHSAALEKLNDCATESWAKGLVGSWNSAGWFDLAAKLGGKLSGLIGAEPGEVMVTDTVSVNLFKLAASALPLTQGKRQICVDAEEFPTDQYIAEAFANLTSLACRRVNPGEDFDALSDGGVYIKSAVNYRSGERVDMKAYEEKARDSGALLLWDLSHATGVINLDMKAAGAKLATGCTYKYLNGGPGAPSFLYAEKNLLPKLQTPLPGWMGHAAPFEFDGYYKPRESAARFASGTPPILSLSALEGALEAFDDIDMKALEAKAGALGDLCIARAEEIGLEVMSPRESSKRGGHVSLKVKNGYPVTRALHAQGFQSDFRSPDTIRFGFSPLYLRYVDVWDLMGALSEILDTKSWDAPAFHARSKVT